MRKDERGASTGPTRRMTCEGETSKDDEDVAGARARSHGTTATKLYKQAYPVATGLVRGSTP